MFACISFFLLFLFIIFLDFLSHLLINPYSSLNFSLFPLLSLPFSFSRSFPRSLPPSLPPSFLYSLKPNAYSYTPTPQCVFLTLKELERIKRESIIKSGLLLEQERKKEGNVNAQKNQISEERKFHMRKLSAENLLLSERKEAESEKSRKEKNRQDSVQETVCMLSLLACFVP
jgi:hypothetical protein